MDPSTIANVLQITVSAARGAWWVYSLLRDARNIDQTATAFVSEIETLAIACDAVGGLIKEREQGRKDGLERLWQCLQGRLEACDATVSDLELAVQYVVNGSKQKHNFFSPIVRQIYLNGKGKDIENARTLIRGHTTSLQIVLQVVGVNVTYLATGAIDAQLPLSLQRLRGTTQELEKLRGQRDARSVYTLEDNEAELIRVSNDVVSSGETLYAASNAGSIIAGSAYGGRHAISAQMSVYGGTPERITSTNSWLKDQGALDKLPSMSSSPSLPETRVPSVFSQRSPGRMSSAEQHSFYIDRPETSRTTDGHESPLTAEEPYSDSDDEDEIDAVQAAIQTGRALFEAKKYREASARLLVAMRMIQRLPSRRESAYRLADLRYMLAICSYYVQPPAEAFETLFKIVTSNVEATAESGNENNAKMLEATHLLAITCVRLDKMRHARYYCKAARKGRRKLRDQDPLPYFESVALMAKIEELEGNDDEADILNDMIPDEQRKNLDVAIQELSSAELTRRNSLSTGLSLTQTNNESIESSVDPFRDIDMLAGKTLDLKIGISEDSAPQQKVARRGTTASTISFPSEKQLNYKYRHAALEEVAHSIGYFSPPLADLNTRRTWKMFLKFIPKKDDRLTEALLENRQQEAWKIVNSQNQTRQRIWQGAGSSPISRKDLHLAALFGEIEVVDRLLRCGANVKHKWIDGLTALHCAVMGGYREIAVKLIHAGCPYDAVSERFGSALSLATLGEKIDVLDLLLEHTNHLLAEYSYLGSAVHAAIVTGKVSLIKALTLEKGTTDVPRQFYPAQARKLHHLLTTHTLLTPMDDALLAPHTEARLERIDGPVLAVAAYMGREEAVVYLLSQTDVAVDTTCKAETVLTNSLRSGSSQHTALTLAAMSGHDGIVQLLLERSANMRSANFEHADPLFLAVLNGRESSALLLEEYGANVRPSAVDLAAKRKMVALVTKLRARNAGAASPGAASPLPRRVDTSPPVGYGMGSKRASDVSSSTHDSGIYNFIRLS